MEIRQERGFPSRLEKSLANEARLFHSSHRPGGGDQLKTCFRQRSTCQGLNFYPQRSGAKSNHRKGPIQVDESTWAPWSVIQVIDRPIRPSFLAVGCED